MFLEKPSLAIDFGNTGARILLGQKNNNYFHVCAFAEFNYPEGSVDSSLCANPEKVSQSLSSLMQSEGIKEKNALLSIPSSAAICRRVRLKAPNHKELSLAIKFEVNNIFPEKGNLISYDYQVLNKTSKSAWDVLVVGAKKTVVESWQSVLHNVGLEPLLMDIEGICLANVFEFLYPEEFFNGTTILIKIDTSSAVVVILEEGLLLNMTVINQGAGNIVNNDDGKAKGLKLLDSYEDLESCGKSLAKQIANILNFQMEGISGVFVSGLVNEELCKFISDEIGVKVIKLETTEKVSFSNDIDHDLIELLWDEMFVCMGLALRKPGDRVK